MKKIILPLLLLGITSTVHTPTTITNPSEQTEKKINLYIYPGCPYCKKVTQLLKKHGWIDKVTIINANLADNYAMLQKLSNNTQCPFLQDKINGVNMLESKAIMNYFTKLFSAS